MKGAKISFEGDFRKPVVNMLKKGLEQNAFDAVLTPMRIPSVESFAWILTQDPELLEKAHFMPPVISVQGAKALSSFTRLGQADSRIVALMRPCEVRAAVELSKLQELSLDNVVLLSVDCPGSLPSAQYMDDPEDGDEVFHSLLGNWDSGPVREICKVCDRFGMTASDIHVGLLAGESRDLFVIPCSEKGKAILADLEIDAQQDLDAWVSQTEKISSERKKKREEMWAEIRKEYGGAENLLGLFSRCITCHTCRSVCPICHCRQCYFESDAFKLPAYNYQERAQQRGSLRLPPDNLLFHLGRMQHMGMSCVSCGLCEDMCPLSIPISHLFGYVADRAQSIFGYAAGMAPEEALPLTTYLTEELEAIPESYTEILEESEKKNA